MYIAVFFSSILFFIIYIYICLYIYCSTQYIYIVLRMIILYESVQWQSYLNLRIKIAHNNLSVTLLCQGRCHFLVTSVHTYTPFAFSVKKHRVGGAQRETVRPYWSVVILTINMHLHEFIYKTRLVFFLEIQTNKTDIWKTYYQNMLLLFLLQLTSVLL